MNLIKADFEHLDMFRRYVKKCIDDGLDLYASAKNDPDAYLTKRIAYSAGKSLPEGWPPISTYFYIQYDEIIGSIRVRHGDNEYIFESKAKFRIRSKHHRRCQSPINMCK